LDDEFFGPKFAFVAMTFCGIDFGTSNTSVCVLKNGIITPVPLEGDHTTLPSAIFFKPKTEQALYGRAAIACMTARDDGRFMRSLKRVLGTDLMDSGTRVNGQSMKFTTILGDFIRHAKIKAEAFAGAPINKVVMGRPVRFVDNNPKADQRAEAQLAAIASSAGFEDIFFQYEPIAAAFAHEADLNTEKLALVADIGGGTSDFSVIRLSPQRIKEQDRTRDILSNTGVRIGGNDLDKQLSLACFMPAFGYDTTYGTKHIPMPKILYQDLAEWSKINQVYTPKNLRTFKECMNQADEPDKVKRFYEVLSEENGHALLGAVEETKIQLTAMENYTAHLDFMHDPFDITVARADFENALLIQNALAKMASAAQSCLAEAGVGADNIGLLILTGGSTEIPCVQQVFTALCPHAAIAGDDKLGSVGRGLAFEAMRRFSPC
jgi:hypothetical chaperone protein